MRLRSTSVPPDCCHRRAAAVILSASLLASSRPVSKPRQLRELILWRRLGGIARLRRPDDRPDRSANGTGGQELAGAAAQQAPPGITSGRQQGSVRVCCCATLWETHTKNSSRRAATTLSRRLCGQLCLCAAVGAAEDQVRPLASSKLQRIRGNPSEGGRSFSHTHNRAGGRNAAALPAARHFAAPPAETPRRAVAKCCAGPTLPRTGSRSLVSATWSEQ